MWYLILQWRASPTWTMHIVTAPAIYKPRFFLVSLIDSLFSTIYPLILYLPSLFAMKIKFSKIFRRRKSTGLRKHSSQPSINTLLGDFRPSSTSSAESDPPKRSKSCSRTHEVQWKSRTTSTLEPCVLTLLPTTLTPVAVDDRCSFTTRLRSRPTTTSFVRKMRHPRSLPVTPRLTPNTLTNGNLRRSLPDLCNEVVLTWTKNIHILNMLCSRWNKVLSFYL